MRKIGLNVATFLSIFFTAAIARAEVCGLYQIEDFRDHSVYSFTDLGPQAFRQIHFTITNPSSHVVQQMVNNMCYCVNGRIGPDPEWSTDPSFKMLTITKILFGPSTSCYSHN